MEQICQKLATTMRGGVFAQSDGLGLGSKFTFFMPIEAVPEVVAQRRGALHRSESSEELRKITPRLGSTNQSGGQRGRPPRAASSFGGAQLSGENKRAADDSEAVARFSRAQSGGTCHVMPTVRSDTAFWAGAMATGAEPEAPPPAWSERARDSTGEPFPSSGSLDTACSQRSLLSSGLLAAAQFACRPDLFAVFDPPRCLAPHPSLHR